MTIYWEILFAENFITGAIILALTGKLCGIKTEKRRVVTGAVMCGIYAFILVVPMHWILALVSKLVFSVAVAAVSFGYLTWRGTLKATGVFYIVSFLMGGVTIALMYMLKIPGMTGNGSFVIGGGTFLKIAAGVAGTWYLGSWLAGLYRERVLKSRIMHQVTVCIAEHEWKMKAMVDTGNSLKDPITGWPVAVLSKEASENICRKCDSEQFPRYSAIPYRTVGRSGVMFGIRPDCVIVDENIVTDIVLGFGEKDFSPWRGTEKYDLLLHQQFLEGEDMTYGQEYDDDSEFVGTV